MGGIMIEIPTLATANDYLDDRNNCCECAEIPHGDSDVDDDGYKNNSSLKTKAISTISTGSIRLTFCSKSNRIVHKHQKWDLYLVNYPSAKRPFILQSCLKHRAIT